MQLTRCGNLAPDFKYPQTAVIFLKTTFYSTDFNDSTISICAVNLHTISWIKREQPTTINETIIYDINRK